MPSFRRLLPFPVVALMLAVPGGGHAAEFCVGTTNTTCDGGHLPFNTAGFTAAIQGASDAPGFDGVRLGQGTLTISTPISINNAAGIAVRGAGIGKTTISSSIPTGTAFGMSGALNSVLDLTLQTTGFTGDGTILSVHDGATAHDVAVIETSPAANNWAVDGTKLGSGATLTNATVQMNSPNDVGSVQTNGSANLVNVSLAGANSARGVNASNNPGSVQTMTRVRISGFKDAVASDLGLVNISDSVIDLGSRAGATGLTFLNPNNSTGTNTVNLTRSTIVGSGDSQRGVVIQADTATETAAGTLAGSLVQLTGAAAIDLRCKEANSGTATLTSTYSAFSTNQIEGPCGDTATSVINLGAEAAKFRNAAAGDFRPTWDSPVIDAGSAVQPGASIDFAGATRFVDGDWIAGKALDIGALEYQGSSPGWPVVSWPAGGVAGTPVTFSAMSTDSDGDPVTLTWTFGDGESATGTTVSHSWASAGTYNVKVTATDPFGRWSSTQTPFAVTSPAPSAEAGTTPAAPAGAPAAAGGAAPAAPAAAAPGGSAVAAAAPAATLINRPKAAFKRGNKGFKVLELAGKRTIGLALQQTSAVELTLARVKAGHKRAVQGSATLPVGTPTTQLGFGGKFAGKRLAAGKYQLTITPLRGAVRGTPVSLTIKVA